MYDHLSYLPFQHHFWLTCLSIQLLFCRGVLMELRMSLSFVAVILGCCCCCCCCCRRCCWRLGHCCCCCCCLPWILWFYFSVDWLASPIISLVKGQAVKGIVLYPRIQWFCCWRPCCAGDYVILNFFLKVVLFVKLLAQKLSYLDCS